MERFFTISDIAIINSQVKEKSEVINQFNLGKFSDFNSWNNIHGSKNIDTLGDCISSRIKGRMSQLSLGVCDVLEKGAFSGSNFDENQEIVLFTAFGEIETTNQIIKNIMVDNYEHVSPTLFHNSVHNTPLGYYTIIKKIHNHCLTISDGLKTGVSFINFINNQVLLNKRFTIVHGDEYSEFNELDKVKLKLFPIFISYNVLPSENNSGFRFLSIITDFKNIIKLVEEADFAFVDKCTFLELKEENCIDIDNVYSEYPICFDNPCGIIYRIALPFYLNLKGYIIIIEKVEENYYCYEVRL